MAEEIYRIALEKMGEVAAPVLTKFIERKKLSMQEWMIFNTYSLAQLQKEVRGVGEGIKGLSTDLQLYATQTSSKLEIIDRKLMAVCGVTNDTYKAVQGLRNGQSELTSVVKGEVVPLLREISGKLDQPDGHYKSGRRRKR